MVKMQGGVFGAVATSAAFVEGSAMNAARALRRTRRWASPPPA